MPENKYAINRKANTDWLDTTANFFTAIAGLGSVASGVLTQIDENKTAQINSFLSGHTEDVYKLDEYMEGVYGTSSNRSDYKPETISAATGVSQDVVSAFLYSRAFSDNDSRENVSWGDRQLKANKIDPKYNFKNYADARTKVANSAVLSKNVEHSDSLDKAAGEMSHEELVEAFKMKDYSKIAEKAGVTDEDVIKAWGASRNYDTQAFEANADFLEYNIQYGNISAEASYRSREEAEANQESDEMKIALLYQYQKEFSDINQWIDVQNKNAIMDMNDGKMSKEEYSEFMEKIIKPEEVAKATGIDTELAKKLLDLSVQWSDKYAQEGIGWSAAGVAQGVFSVENNPSAVREALINGYYKQLDTMIEGLIFGDKNLSETDSAYNGIFAGIASDPTIEIDDYGNVASDSLASLLSENGYLRTKAKELGIPDSAVDEWINSNEDLLAKRVDAVSENMKQRATVAKNQTLFENNLNNLATDVYSDKSNDDIVKDAVDYTNQAVSGGCCSKIDAVTVTIQALSANALTGAMQSYSANPKLSVQDLIDVYDERYNELVSKYMNNVGEGMNELADNIMKTKALEASDPTTIRSSLEQFKTSYDNELKEWAKNAKTAISKTLAEAAAEGSFATENKILEMYGYSSIDDVPDAVLETVNDSINEANLMQFRASVSKNKSWTEAVVDIQRANQRASMTVDEYGNRTYEAKPMYVTFSGGSVAAAEKAIANARQQKKDLANESRHALPEDRETAKTQVDAKMGLLDSRIEDSLNSLYLNLENTSAYKAGTYPKEGEGILLEDGTGFWETVTSMCIETNPAAVMTLALEWQKAYKQITSVTAFDLLKDRYSYTGNEEFMNEVTYSYAMKQISRKEYDELKGMMNMSDSEKVVYDTINTAVKGLISDMFGTENTLNAEAIYTKQSILSNIENMKPAMLDMMRNNGGKLSVADVNKFIEPLKDGYLAKNVEDALKYAYSRMDFWSGAFPPLAQMNEKQLLAYNTGKALYNDIAAGRAPWYHGDETFSDIIKYISSANRELSSTDIRDYVSNLMFGKSYDELESSKAGQQLVDLNIAPAIYASDCFIDICNAAGLRSIGTNILGDYQNTLKEGCIAINVDGGAFGVMDTNTGDVWWYRTSSDTELTHAKMNGSQLAFANYQNAYSGRTSIASSRLTII